MKQAATMLKEVHAYYQQPLLIVADSWFGNDGLWSLLERGAQGCFHLLSRMRTNNTLYDFAPALAQGEKRKAGRPKKYGDRLGSVDEFASRWKIESWFKEIEQDIGRNGGLSAGKGMGK